MGLAYWAMGVSRAAWVCLYLLPQHCDYKPEPPHLGFYVGVRFKLRSSCLNSKHFINRANSTTQHGFSVVDFDGACFILWFYFALVVNDLGCFSVLFLTYDCGCPPCL